MGRIINSSLFFAFLTAILLLLSINSVHLLSTIVHGAPLLFLGGAWAGATLLFALVWREGTLLEFINVVDHEFTHSMVSVLFSQKVQELYANSEGHGHSLSSGNENAFGAKVIALAPYLVSVGIVVLIALQLLGASSFHQPLVLAGGIYLGYRTVSLFRDARPYQSDFSYTGYPWGILWVVIFFTFFVSFEVAYALNGRAGVLSLMHYSALVSWEQVVSWVHGVGVWCHEVALPQLISWYNATVRFE